jgi:FtsZ-interacting cell division protein ZipA
MQSAIIVAGIMIVCLLVMVIFWRRTRKGHKKSKTGHQKSHDATTEASNKNSSLLAQEQEIDHLIDLINNT